MEGLESFLFDLSSLADGARGGRVVPRVLTKDASNVSTLDSAYFMVFDVPKNLNASTYSLSNLSNVFRTVNRISSIFVAGFDTNSGEFPVFLDNTLFLTNVFDSISYLHRTNKKEATAVNQRVAAGEDKFNVYLIESEGVGKQLVTLDLSADQDRGFAILDLNGNIIHSREYSDSFVVVLSPYDVSTFMIYSSDSERFIFKAEGGILRDVIANMFVKKKSPIQGAGYYYVSCPSKKHRMFVKSNIAAPAGVLPESEFRFDGPSKKEGAIVYSVLLMNSLQRLQRGVFSVNLYDTHFTISMNGEETVKREYSLFSHPFSPKESLVVRMVIDEYSYVYLGFRSYEYKESFIRHFKMKKAAKLSLEEYPDTSYSCVTRSRGVEMDIVITLSMGCFTVENKTTEEVFSSGYSAYNTIKLAPAKSIDVERRACHLHLKDNMYLKMVFESDEDLSNFVVDFRDRRNRMLSEISAVEDVVAQEKKELNCYVIEDDTYLGICTIRVLPGHIDIFKDGRVVKAYSLDFSKVYIDSADPKQLKLQFLGGKYLQLGFQTVYDLKHFMEDYKRASFEILGSKRRTEKEDGVEISTYLDGVVEGETILPKPSQRTAVHAFSTGIVNRRGRKVTNAVIELGFEKLSLLIERDKSRCEASLDKVVFLRSKNKELAHIQIGEECEYNLSITRPAMDRIRFLLDRYSENSIFFADEREADRSTQVLDGIEEYSKHLQDSSEFDVNTVMTIDVLDKSWKAVKTGAELVLKKKKTWKKVIVEVVGVHKFRIGRNFVMKEHKAIPALEIGSHLEIEYVYKFPSEEDKALFVKTISPYLMDADTDEPEPETESTTTSKVLTKEESDKPQE